MEFIGLFSYNPRKFIHEKFLLSNPQKLPPQNYSSIRYIILCSYTPEVSYVAMFKERMYVCSYNIMHVYMFVYRNALRHAFYILSTGKPDDRVSVYFVTCTPCVQAYMYFICSKTWAG